MISFPANCKDAHLNAGLSSSSWTHQQYPGKVEDSGIVGFYVIVIVVGDSAAATADTIGR